MYFNKIKLIIILNIFIFILHDIQDNWGLGIGDWGLGIGDWAQSPIPKNQNPKPKNKKKK